MLKKFLYAFGFLAVLLTLIPLLNFDYWWIRMLDFPHIQLTFLTALALLFFTYKFDLHNVKDYLFVGLLLLCFGLQFTKLYPYTEIASEKLLEASANTKGIKVLTANVLQKNDKYQLLEKEIKDLDPDILLLTEVNKTWLNSIATTTNSAYTYSKKYPLENTYGMALYSKLPLVSPEVKFLVSDTIPSIHTKVILQSGDTIQLFAIHPTPPILYENKTSTDRDAEMMMVAKKAMQAKNPVMVVGDFNDVAWAETSRVFERIGKLIDARVGRYFYNTYDSNSFIMKWPLDYIYVTKEFRFKDIAIRNDIGSDHYPYFVEFSFEPNKDKAQELPDVSKADLKFMNNQIESFLKEQRKSSN